MGFHGFIIDNFVLLKQQTVVYAISIPTKHFKKT